MRCAKCGAKVRDGGHPTPLGETACQQCSDIVTGAALGLVAGGGLGGALAGPGILRWMRESLHPEKKRERLAAQAEAAPEARD